MLAALSFYGLQGTRIGATALHLSDVVVSVSVTAITAL